MPPILVIDDDGPSRAARSALQRDGAVARTSSAASGQKAPRYDAMIADTCMLDAHGTARVHALMQGVPRARLVARARSGAMAAIGDAPDFDAMAIRLVAK
jgi:hypothetical protein